MVSLFSSNSIRRFIAFITGFSWVGGQFMSPDFSGHDSLLNLNLILEHEENVILCTVGKERQYKKREKVFLDSLC